MANFQVNTARSYYKTHPEVLTTFNTSYLIPLKCFKVMPNGTYKISAGTIARLPALKVPVMGKLWLEFFAFYVPYDLLDKRFEKLITEGHDNSFDEDLFGQGSNTPNPESVGASMVPDLFTPKLVNPNSKDGFEVFSGDLLNRLGLPIANAQAHAKSVKYDEDLKKSCTITNDKGEIIFDEQRYIKFRKRIVPAFIPNGKESAYPVRAYHEIFNKSFRSKFLQNLKQTDYGISESDPANFELLRVNRAPDWFSRGFVSAMLNPVQVPIGVGELPVVADSKFAPIDSIVDLSDVDIVRDGLSEFKLSKPDNSSVNSSIFVNNNYQGLLKDITNPDETKGLAYHSGLAINGIGRLLGNGADIASINPRVNLANAIALNINDLRYTIGLAHMSEKALYGTDLDTILKMNFNLILPKVCLKEPYLFGYKKVPVEINQITQTAPSTDETSNVGDVYGQSTTVRRLDDDSFTFRAYNFGLIMLLCCVRHESVYQYGIDPIFEENDKFSYFQPDLQGLSNVGIPKKYIYFSGVEADDESVFNFNEPFSEYKHDHNVVNGEFASDSDTPLDFYTLADIYQSAPSYDDEWIKDTTKEVLDRSLTITSENSNQVHFYLKTTYERTLPMKDYIIGIDYI